MTDEFSDDNWFENDDLARLDEEIDPPWPDWVHHWHEGWENLERGADVWMLDRSTVGVNLPRLISKSAGRLRRFREIGAPRIVILNEERLMARLMAWYWWNHFRQVDGALELIRKDSREQRRET